MHFSRSPYRPAIVDYDDVDVQSPNSMRKNTTSLSVLHCANKIAVTDRHRPCGAAWEFGVLRLKGNFIAITHVA